jgi:hypothetical protein
MASSRSPHHPFDRPLAGQSTTPTLARHRVGQPRAPAFAAMGLCALTACGGGGGGGAATSPSATGATPPGLTGPLVTLHLLNTDLGATAPTPRHEVCSNDAAEALACQEQRSSWQGSYADLVETNASERLFEFVRVPRADPTARLRHRILRCAWLDRAATDLDLDSGAAGALTRRLETLESFRSRRAPRGRRALRRWRCRCR